MEGTGAVLRYVAQDARTGYGDAADRLVRAMRESGVRVEYRGWSTGRDGYPVGLRQHSRDPLPGERAVPGAPTIAHLVPEHYPAVRDALAELPGPSGPLISQTVWETDRLPKHWPALLNDVDRVIVPTEWNRDVFTTCGVTTPVAVLPHVVCDPVPGDGGVSLGLPDDAVVFYTISRWDERKAPHTVLRAFLEAFTADDPVALVVKTSANAQFPPPGGWGDSSALHGSTVLEVARIVREYPRPAPVRVEIDEWTPARIAGLHARGDCFVSLSHGEGWDLGAFDACAFGNPVVMTGWGGQLVYLQPESALLVEYDLAPVQHFEPDSYSPDQHWAVPRPEHAVERLREVAADIGAARDRAEPLRELVLRAYAGPLVVAQLRERVPELAPAFAQITGPAAYGPGIPRIAHFVFGLRPEPEALHLVHYLAIRSCLDVVRPDAVHLHCHHLPTGPWWDRIAGDVIVHAVEPASAVSEHAYRDPLVARYAYAHHADFVRLDVLAEHGGLYADLDTLFVAPVPEQLWQQDFVIGRDADVPNPDGGVPRPALSNAVLMATPDSFFLAAWRDEIGGALDGTWAAHSCLLAHDLAARMPGDVRVEPQRLFHAFEPSPEGISLLLEHAVADLRGIMSLHLAAHLWWDEDRRDFSAVHASTINEEWVRTADATYAIAARRFLFARDVRI